MSPFFDVEFLAEQHEAQQAELAYIRANESDDYDMNAESACEAQAERDFQDSHLPF